MYIGLIVYMLVIVTVGGFIMSKKFRSFIIAVILCAMLIYGAFAMQNAVAEDFITIEGTIIRVAPGFIDNHPMLIVTVETINGEVYTYFSEEEIDVQGTVLITLFNDEVINVE